VSYTNTAILVYVDPSGHQSGKNGKQKIKFLNIFLGRTNGSEMLNLDGCIVRLFGWSVSGMCPLVGANSAVCFGVYGLSVGLSVCTGSCKDCEVRSLTRTNLHLC
jgi:hypothetical protein